MAGSPELLPIVEAESAGGTPRLQIGPQCCCTTPTIDCSGLELPELIGVEFHGAPSDPGGDSFCDDFVTRFSNIPKDLLYSYAPELIDFFGVPVEVQYYPDLTACTWCLPETGEWIQEEKPPLSGSGGSCTHVVPNCKGIVEIGGNRYGFQDVAASSFTSHASCFTPCDELFEDQSEFHLSSYPFLLNGLQLSVTVGGGGIDVAVTFATELRQGLVSIEHYLECDGSTTYNLWNCEESLNITPLSGTFSRTFPAGSTWADIKNQTISGTVTGYNESGSGCMSIDGRGIAIAQGACVPGVGEGALTISCVGDYRLPRLVVSDAYCILRDV